MDDLVEIPARKGRVVGDLLLVSKPGDHVMFRAGTDAVLTFSACPHGKTPVNGAACAPVEAHFTVI